jgi:hypothetical protein
LLEFYALGTEDFLRIANMNSDPSLRAIFIEALDRSDAAERTSYLDEACGADAAQDGV